MSNLFTFSTLIFLGATLINVILQTVKSVLTITASKIVAAIINAIAFGFYAIVIKATAGLDLSITIPITIIGNLIGVWVALTLIKKFTKDKVWRITTTLKDIDSGEVTEKLAKYGISYVVYIGEGVKIVDIYSKTQGESSLIKEILKSIKAKYFIVQMDKNF